MQLAALAIYTLSENVVIYGTTGSLQQLVCDTTHANLQ